TRCSKTSTCAEFGNGERPGRGRAAPQIRDVGEGPGPRQLHRCPLRAPAAMSDGGMPRSFPSPTREDRAPVRDTVLEVMERELTRSMDGLTIPGSPKPYWMQYTLRRSHALRIRAAYGSLVRSREQTNANVYVECRVGSHKFDNA